MSHVLKHSTVLNLRLVQAEEGFFEVWHDDKMLLRTRVESLARITYSEQSEVLGEAMSKTLRSERRHFDMQGARSESFARRAASAQKKGGKGGRGGV